MRNKMGTFCMILGAGLVIVALLLFGWNQWEAWRAEQFTGTALPALIEESRKSASGDLVSLDPDMTEVMIDGYGYIGYLSIPSLNLELPVMSEWDYARLRISPCWYFGSTKTGNLVIAAHNYTRHFGLLSELSPGNTVYFTDMDGIVTRYTVAEVDVLAPTDVEKMTDGKYELTLFTCTYGGRSRVTVRCDQVEQDAE